MTGIGKTGSTRKHSPNGCDGCKYRSSHHDWCNYSDVTGRSRLAMGGKLHENGGCSLYLNYGTKVRRWSPLGAGRSSTRVVTEKPNPKQQDTSKYRNKTKEELETIRRYYEQGMSDGQICKATGFSKRTVRNWRQKNGLESNYTIMREEMRNGE